jgi:hypothetical protein
MFLLCTEQGSIIALFLFFQEVSQEVSQEVISFLPNGCPGQIQRIDQETVKDALKRHKISVNKVYTHLIKTKSCCFCASITLREVQYNGKSGKLLSWVNDKGR